MLDRQRDRCGPRPGGRRGPSRPRRRVRVLRDRARPPRAGRRSVRRRGGRPGRRMRPTAWRCTPVGPVAGHRTGRGAGAHRWGGAPAGGGGGAGDHRDRRRRGGRGGRGGRGLPGRTSRPLGGPRRSCLRRHPQGTGLRIGRVPGSRLRPGGPGRRRGVPDRHPGVGRVPDSRPGVGRVPDRRTDLGRAAGRRTDVDGIAARGREEVRRRRRGRGWLDRRIRLRTGPGSRAGDLSGSSGGPARAPRVPGHRPVDGDPLVGGIARRRVLRRPVLHCPASVLSRPTPRSTSPTRGRPARPGTRSPRNR